MKKISIVTISKNNAEGLAKTLASVFAQTRGIFESVVIDGGSDDGTPEVLRTYSDRIAHLESKPDRGIYEAMNKGVRASKGEYLLFLNSGDVFANERTLEDVESSLDGTPILSFRVLRKDRPGGFISKRKYNCLTILPAFIPHQATFIRRDLFDRFGLYDESYRLISDWIFFYRTMHCAKIPYRVIDHPVAIMDETGMSARHPEIIEQERKRFYREEVPFAIRTLFGLKECVRKTLPGSVWNALRKMMKVETW